MTIHVEYDIRTGEGVLKTDGTVAVRTRRITEVTATLDACKIPYIYQEHGHPPLYDKGMEWRNEPEEEERKLMQTNTEDRSEYDDLS